MPHWYATGTTSFVAIARELNEGGFRTRYRARRGSGEADGRAWTSQSVSTLLANPVYAGHVTLKGDRLPGRHEAIVPEELFAQVERIRQSSRGRRAVPRRDIYLLRGIVRCSVDLSRYDAGGTPLCVEHGEEPRVSSDDPPPPIPPAPRAQCRGDKCNVEVPEGQ